MRRRDRVEEERALLQPERGLLGRARVRSGFERDSRVSPSRMRPASPRSISCQMRVAVLRVPQGRHPVAPHRHRGVRAIDPGSVVLLLVLLRAAEPGVVAQLVVVDGRHHRVAAVQQGEVGVAAVEGVAAVVVLALHAVAERIHRPADVGAGRLLAGRDLRRLVDVVAEVQHEVDVVHLGDGAVGVEEPRVVLGARDDREPHGPVGRDGLEEPVDRAPPSDSNQ